MNENGFWKVCAALANPCRLALLRLLLETKGHPCVNEVADELRRLQFELERKPADLGVSAVSQYLKQLREAGLVACARADKRIYYRPFASTAHGEEIVAAFAGFFRERPASARVDALLDYVHALAHVRRHQIIRCLAEHPKLDIQPLAVRTGIPPQTIVRLLGQLDRAKVVDLTRTIIPPEREPEATLLRLTLA